MCSFDWEKCLLFIYSTWEKECAPSLKRVEKPLWRKKDPCTTTPDIDYHCSYWRHVTFTCVIIEHDTWHWIPVWSMLRKTISKILYSVLWAYLRLCTCPSRKKGHCKKNKMDLRKYVEIIWSAWIPSQYSGDFLFQQCILSKCSLHISGARQFFFFVYVDVLSKSKKEIIKNNITENDFFPCKQSSTQNMYM